MTKQGRWGIAILEQFGKADEFLNFAEIE